MTQLSTLRPVVEFIERRLGLRCVGARADVVADLIRAEMRRLGLRAPTAYARHLEQDAAAVEDLAEALRVPETYFLREPAQLRLLSDQVLPDLAADRGGRALRIWSAGCASGEEAYSLAIVGEWAGLAGRLQILATDRSEPAIVAARRGVYRPRSLRSVTAAERACHFAPDVDGVGAVVADRLRHGITFRTHDLVDGSYPVDQDLIVCRNVLLYLTREQGAAVVRGLAASLAPGGWLVLGSADPHHHAASLLERVRGPAGSLYRRGDTSPVQAPPRRGRRRQLRPRTAPHASAGSRAQRREHVPTSSAHSEPVSVLHGCERDLAERPLDAELHARHATLLLEAGQPVRARWAATAALFLAPDLAAAHVLLGRAHLALGEPVPAERAFRNAQRLLDRLPADAAVSTTEAPAGRLMAVVEEAQRRARQRTAS